MATSDLTKCNAFRVRLANAEGLVGAPADWFLVVLDWTQGPLMKAAERRLQDLHDQLVVIHKMESDTPTWLRISIDPYDSPSFDWMPKNE